MKATKRAVLGASALVGVVALAGALFHNSELWPQAPIIVGMPFVHADAPYQVMPMGETVAHPVANGHPGLDFQWAYPARLVAAIDGRVSEIYEAYENGHHQWNVVIQHGKYVSRYNELGDYELGYTKIVFADDARLCPTPFMTDADAQYLEDLWSEVGHTYDGQFPLLCNGVYDVR